MVYLVSAPFLVFALLSGIYADHQFTLNNLCGRKIQPVIANVNCGHSPRCDTPGSGGIPNPAISYNGPQPDALNPGESQTLTINRQWNGRIFSQDGACGPKGEGCTMTEFNLDTGDTSTPQTYHISNYENFTQSIGISVNRCETVVCASESCECLLAYPPQDFSKCAIDSPVRGCSAGDHDWIVMFCPELVF